jgi:hypothetical protein
MQLGMSMMLPPMVVSVSIATTTNTTAIATAIDVADICVHENLISSVFIQKQSLGLWIVRKQIDRLVLRATFYIVKV